MKASIDDSATVITLISTFTTVPEKRVRDRSLTEAILGRISFEHGRLVGASVHVSLDETRVVCTFNDERRLLQADVL